MSSRRTKGIRRRRSSSRGSLSLSSSQPSNNTSINTTMSASSSSPAVPPTEKQHVAVLYHCPCHDGAYAALAAYLRFRDDPAYDVTYVPHFVYKPMDITNKRIFTPNTIVYLVDYCGAPGFINSVAPLVKKVILLDHHKTAIELIDELKTKNTIPPNFECTLELKQSGATISRDYFHAQKSLTTGFSADRQEAQSRMYALVEDNDLWRHAIADSKDWTTGLANLKIEWDFARNPTLFDTLININVDDVITEGRKSRVIQEQIIETELTNILTIALNGDAEKYGRCLAVITTHPDLRSSMGNVLATRSKALYGLRAMSAVVYTEPEMKNADKNWKVSLRSNGPTEDTTVISSANGGGGHLNASSFIMPREDFNKWIVPTPPLLPVSSSSSPAVAAVAETKDVAATATASASKRARVEHPRVVIGVTGGISSGKSSISKRMTAYGCYIIDADKIGHTIYAPGTDCFTKVVEVFGQHIVGSDGSIDRKILGGIVFGNPPEMKKLTSVVWPAIQTKLIAEIDEAATAGHQWIVVEAAVLAEAGWASVFDEIWVVEVGTDIARTRLMARNNLTEDEANRRIASQTSLTERRRIATFTIDNSSTLEASQAIANTELTRLRTKYADRFRPQSGL